MPIQSTRRIATRIVSDVLAERAVCIAGPSRLATAQHNARRAQTTWTSTISSSHDAQLHGLPLAGAPTKTLTQEQLAAEEEELEWKRNLNQVREWRRNQSQIHQQLQSSSSKSSSSSTQSPQSLLLSRLIASGAELGHHPSLLHPSYLPYIYGTRANLSIIDLDQTVPLLRRAANFVREVVENDGVVLVVGTREGHRDMVRKSVERLGGNGFGVAGEKWMAGTLTNSFSYFGIQPITNRSHLPDLAIFLNPSENLSAIRECTASNVPTIGLVDTDTDPRIVTWAIPSNMESLRTAELVVSTLSFAGKAGREKRLSKEVASIRRR